MYKTVDYIFSINTGRSGSHYLAHVFEKVEGCIAFHEPYPIGHDKAMHLFAQGHTETMEKLAQEKAAKIRKLQQKHGQYVETNHCFIKGFGWYMPGLLGEENIGVIILRRNKDEIADSYLRKNTSPLRKLGRLWITSPDKRNPKIKPPVLFLTPWLSIRLGRILKNILRLFSNDSSRKAIPQWIINYELACLKWYVDETEAETEIFRKQFPKIRYYEVDIKDLNKLENVNAMLNFFGCPPLAEDNGVVGEVTNRKVIS